MMVSVGMGKRWLHLLIQDNGAIEVRSQTPSGWKSGWFDNVGDIVATILQNEGVNLLTSFNKAVGREITNSLSWDAKALKNDDVESYSRLLFDFDPVRPAGVPSTNSELETTKQRAIGFMSDMQQRGFPQAAWGVSGNGVHVLYRCSYVNDEAARKHISRLYQVLSKKYSDTAVTLDPVVCNPGRLTRLYLMINRKGTATAGRPHRLSTIWVPKNYTHLPAESLWSLICDMGADKEPERLPRPVESKGPCGRGDYTTLDIVSWFDSKGLYQKPVGGNKHAVTCPWSHEHSGSGGTGETIVYEPDGSWAGFYCHHAHCEGRTIRHVLEYLDGADQHCARELGRPTKRGASL